MFPTFISILDIQSWWEVPSIAHFCSLFRTAFKLLDFDIEDLEEALLTDGTEETSWLEELIVLLLKGCLPKNEISIFNYQMFLRRLFRKKCQEHDLVNPFNTDEDFQLLPLRVKVNILHSLCDFRLEATDVIEKLKNLEADSLRVEPLGYDANKSAYWYFYGTRLYREDKPASKKSVWQVICFTLNDWTQLVRKFEKSSSRKERDLFNTLNENFIPELPRLFKEKESLARKRLIERLPRRTSNRLRIKEEKADKPPVKVEEPDVIEKDKKSNHRPREERRSLIENRINTRSLDQEVKVEDSENEDQSAGRYEMAGAKSKDRKSKAKQQKDTDNVGSRSSSRNISNAQDKAQNKPETEVKPVGRQTNNSLASATGQILIQPVSNPNRKKLKTSQVFSQTEEDLQTGLHKILDHVKNHDDAWPFIEPVEEEYAPNYYTIIRKPMDLQRMEERLESGHYKTFSKFKTDFQLIVNNCRLYNGVDNEYSEMVDNLLEVFNRAVERFLDQITSSDEEIAVEYPDSDKEKTSKKKKNESVILSQSRRKPTLAAQTDKKKEPSPEPEEESPYESEEDVSLSKRVLRKDEPTKAKKEKGRVTKKEKEKENLKNNKKRKEPPEEVEVKPKRQKVTPEATEILKSKKNKDPSEERETVKSKKNKEPSEEREIVKNKKIKEPLEEREAVKSKKVKEPLEEHEVVKSKKNKEPSEEREVVKSKKNKEPSEEREVVKSKKNKEPSEDLEVPKSKKQKEIPIEKEPPQQKNSKKQKEVAEVPKKVKKEEVEKKGKKVEEKCKKAEKVENKKQQKPAVEEKKVPKKPGRKPKKVSPSPERSKSFSRSPSKERFSSSPPPSWPPSSPENRFEFSPKKNNKKNYYTSDEEQADSKEKHKQKNDKWKEIFKDEKPEKERSPSPPKHKDKHNKLRETIEKLKAKSDLTKLKERDLKVYDFESEKTKENLDLSIKPDKNKKDKDIKKKIKKDDYEDDNSTMDSVQSENKNKVNKKGSTNSKNNAGNKNAAIEALTLATEQTLKDINKWLDDTPKFAEFSSDSNSPSHFCGIDDFDNLNSKSEQDKKKIDKPGLARKEGAKEVRKRPFPKDPNKQFRRREVQRTIDRLQPGKSKGNLISNVPSAAKTDELFPLGPLSKIKDTKNSLIVKTDESAPKLSLGSVLDSFGKHKFVDDEPKKEEGEVVVAEETKVKDETEVKKESATKDEPKIDPPKLDNSPGKATPNLSAWFKAFGAPKVQPTVKKPDSSKDEKPEVEPKKEDNIIKKVSLPEPSPNPDSPVMQGQPIPRQRKISTGSSMSERSSFSQDMDSPRVGIDERLGAYPAPYPSPLHKSPSGASPSLRSPLPDASPKGTSYPFNGQIRVGFYQDTVSTKSSPDKSCSPRDNPQSPYAQYSEHVYTPQTTQSPAYSYNNPYYSQPPSYSTSNPTPPYNPEHSPNPPSYYDTSKPLTDQYKSNITSPVNINPASPATPQQPSPSMTQQQPSPSIQPQQSPNVDLFNQENLPAATDQFNQNQQTSVNVDATFRPTDSTKYQSQPQQSAASVEKYRPSIQEDFNKLSQPAPNVDVYNQQTTPSVESFRSQQSNLDVFRQHQTQQQQQQQQVQQQQQQQQVQQQQLQQQQLQQPIPNVESYRAEQTAREKPQQPTPTFPVKKRAYSEIEQVSRYDEQQYSRNNLDISLMSNRLPNEQINPREVPKYVHQNIPEPRPITGQNITQTPQQTNQEVNSLAMRNVPFTSTSNPFNYNETYPINIPSASRSVENERKVDMSKYTNVGYTGAEMAFSRNPQQYNKPEINYSKLTSGSTEQNSSQRFPDNNVMNISTYKSSSQSAIGSIGTSTSVTESSANVNNRLENVTSRLDNYKPEVSIPRPTYSSSASSLDMDQSLAIRGNLANLTHIVDRYQNEDRMLSGLQTGTPSYYADKNLASQHMFSKPISSNSSGLPMFSQPNSMPYSHNIQSTPSVYNRPMSELQNSSMIGQDRNTASLQQQMQEKKSKRRKTSKSGTPPTSAIEATAGNGTAQGFQSYSGLKNSTSMEPSAISLKTASVVPGSAFNFGPTATGLGLGTGLYGDKDAYPNFCSAPNYYMAAAAAAHHRSTPESGEKPARTAHQSGNPQAPGYPFIGAPQPRPPSYPLGGPFMPPHQGSLMDASSPLYQQYIQAGVLHQGLLGPPGAYPPGYHPALSMRQQYDSMTRPSWL